MDNLPADVTSMVGRRAEGAEVKRALSASRLVTLTGVGGVGKTRLALQVSRQLRRAFPDGVWLAALAELGEPELLALSVTQALGMRGSGPDPMAELVDYLRDKRLLLVLDNCEHLVGACAALVARVLPECPEVRVLATSREPLGIGGECTIVVAPLAVPDADRAFTVGEGRGYEAVTLFAQRAAAAAPGFAVTADNHRAVASLCRRLDGVPLAIELAAVRMRALPVEQILARLDDRYELLARRHPAPSSRHQSMRAAVEWSYDLCSEHERVIWARLAVFVGGVDLAAAESVCSGGGVAREAVFEAVAGLVDKSILLREDVGGHARYRLLETIRQYGSERLRERGEETAVRRRHRDHFLGVAERAAAQWFGSQQVALFTGLRNEHANLRAALECCLGEPDAGRLGLRMAGALWIYWLVCGLQREGRLWLDRALAQDAEPSPQRATALWANGYLAALVGEMSLALGMLEECRDVARRHGDRAMPAHATYASGMARFNGGDAAAAVALLEEGVRLERALDGPNPHENVAEALLGLAYCMNGQLDSAVGTLQESRAVSEAHGERWLLSWSLVWLGLAGWLQGQHRQATDHLRDALRHKHALSDLLGIASAVEYLAWTAVAVEDAERGARLLGACRTLWEPLVAYLGGFQVLLGWHDDCVRQVRRALGERNYQEAFRSGTRLTREEAVAYALGGAAETPRRGATAPVEPQVLTRRETQIAELLAHGMSNKEIADRLVIAQRTAEGHVQRILAKLGFSSRVQVATWVAERRYAAGGEQTR
ncbi:LuxR C-terminal-related transcriptional regulator [Streptomyces sp. NPDC048506]|uniref:ATP-binding protein n=1 Tax=Streptomyces sp. NPDC048506 TaxID=3155028 RepID=UPI00341F6F25